MATDIWGHIEYRPKHKQQFVHYKDIDDEDLWNEKNYNTRNYLMFKTIAGTRWAADEIEQLFGLRGLPNDISDEIKQVFKEGEPDYHSASWLNTHELKQCIDYVGEVGIDKLHYKKSDIDNSLKAYMMIYNLMKSKDDAGDYARIVFWFDN